MLQPDVFGVNRQSGANPATLTPGFIFHRSIPIQGRLGVVLPPGNKTQIFDFSFVVNFTTVGTSANEKDASHTTRLVKARPGLTVNVFSRHAVFMWSPKTVLKHGVAAHKCMSLERRGLKGVVLLEYMDFS